jgi:SAM-dependent methyltransferase
MDAQDPTGREEWTTPEHAAGFIARRARLGRAGDGDEVLDELVPLTAAHILDLGTGGGHLIALLATRRPQATFVGLDVSPTMLAAARARFDGNPNVRVLAHDLAHPLPVVGRFDAIVSAFAIHHLEDARKQTLLAEIHERLAPGGIFANLSTSARRRCAWTSRSWRRSATGPTTRTPRTGCALPRRSSAGCGRPGSSMSTACGNGGRWHCWWACTLDSPWM